MANRKDSKNRVLKAGEGIKKIGDREIYYYRWKDSNSKRRYIYRKSLSELRDEEGRINDSLHDKIIYSPNTTVNDIFELWIKIKRGLKDNTFRNYQYMYKTFVYDTFGRKQLIGLTKSDVRKLYIDLVEVRHLKINTVDSLHTVLYQVMELAEEEGYIKSNIASNAMLELKRTKSIDEPKRKALTREQQKLFVECLEWPQNVYIKPVYLVMIDTGLRVGEATGLRWCDIDFENNELSVNHTLVYYHRGECGCGYRVNTPKTKNSNRRVPMTSKLRSALLELKEYQKNNDEHCNMSIDGYTDFAFFNRFGKVYNQAVLNKTLRRIQRDCNLKQIDNSDDYSKETILLPRFTCHILRHTAATRLCESGVNTRFIMDMLGHSDIRTTMNIYVDVTQQFKSDEMNKFEEYLDY